MKWPYFDAAQYLAKYPDVVVSGTDPYRHFSRHGWREGRSGSPYFNAIWYSKMYLGQEKSLDPVAHYLTYGWKQGYQPNPYFSTRWYLDTYPDVKEAGFEPLDHYVQLGWRENRNPSPYFDVRYYLDSNDDVRKAGKEPLAHYIQLGWRERERDPNPYFSTDWYREHHRDLLDDDTCPLLHYIEYGASAGLAPGPRFDPKFYRSRYDDVAEWGEPLAHFLELGRFERRIPHPDVQPPDDPRLADWAAANALTELRVRLLSRELGVLLHKPLPAEVAKASLAKALGSAHCITFDVFDTLVERRSGAPDTIFALLELEARELDPRFADFAALRKQAELEARSAAGMREVTLAEIWGHLSELAGVPLADCARLAQRECALEIEFCEAKPIGLELLRAVLAERLPVYLFSDSYLDRATIEAILVKAGIAGHQALYVSSELGGTKHYGGLFELFLRDTGFAPETVLHLGDNLHSDVAMPRKFHMRSMRLEKSSFMAGSDMLREWFQGPVDSPTKLWQSVIAGELVHREAILQSGSSAPTPVDVLRLVGAQALGPVLLAFAQYLARRARLMGHRCLFFTSRDGFYLREAYEALRAGQPDLPPSRYFMASRRVCHPASIKRFEDVLAVAEVDHFPMKLRDFLATRFLLSDETIVELPVSPDELSRVIVDSKNDEGMRRVLSACREPILARCADHASIYRAYLVETGIDQPGAALVDIGYRGTAQRVISELTGRRIDGLYLISWPEISRLLGRGLRYDTFLSSQGDAKDPLVKYVQILELLCSATHGSIAGFERHGDRICPTLLPSDFHPRTGHALNALREGAMGFVRDMVSGYSKLLAGRQSESLPSMGMLIEFCRIPRLEVVDGLRQHLFEDAFGGAVKPLITNPTSGLAFADALKHGYWAEGTVALWRAVSRGFSGFSWQAGTASLDSFDDLGRTVPGFSAAQTTAGSKANRTKAAA